jgi:hypothetical protein
MAGLFDLGAIMKVCCFLGTLPAKTLAAPPKHDKKIGTFQNFARGVRAAGDEVHTITEVRYEPCDVAFMLGWVHEHGKDAPHLRLRQQILDAQRNHGRRVVIADSNLFLFQDSTNPHYYLRYSFDGVFPKTGEYCDQNPDPARWQQIQQDMGIAVRPWRAAGDHVLITLQRNGGWSMAGRGVDQWCIDTVHEIRRYSRRPIIIRSHPGDKKAYRYVRRITEVLVKQGVRNFFISDANRTLMQDLENAWVLINHNSSPGVAAAIMGVPVISTDIVNSQAHEVSSADLADVESPPTFDRDRWLHRLAQFHWSYQDLVSGQCWRHMRQWVRPS